MTYMKKKCLHTLFPEITYISLYAVCVAIVLCIYLVPKAYAIVDEDVAASTEIQLEYVLSDADEAALMMMQLDHGESVLESLLPISSVQKVVIAFLEPFIEQYRNLLSFVVRSDGQQAAVASASDPKLFFDSANDECIQADKVVKTIPSLTINVLDYGAVGDGRSHTIGSYGADLPEDLKKSIALINSQVVGPNNVYKVEGEVRTLIRTEDHRVQPTDEADWVGILAALIAADLNGGGRVVIPKSTGDYLINHEIWVHSNVTLEWERGSKYFVRMTGRSTTGSVMGNANPWDRLNSIKEFYATFYNDQVCNVTIINPRIDAGGANTIKLYGENGISFANGAQRIRIIGGQIKNSKWGPDGIEEAPIPGNIQGGRALQFESGVKDISVEGTVITNSSIGVSSAAGLGAFKEVADPKNPTVKKVIYSEYRPHTWDNKKEQVRNIAWDIRINKVLIVNTEMPFMFGNLLFGEVDGDGVSYYDRAVNQKVSLTNFTVKNSGRMKSERVLGVKPNPLDSGIIGLLGGKNIKILYGTVTNDSNYPKIGALIRGFGSDLFFGHITLTGQTESLVDFTGGFGTNPRNAETKNAVVSHISQFGDTKYLVDGKIIKNLSFGPVTYTNLTGQFIHCNLLKENTSKDLSASRVGYAQSATTTSEVGGVQVAKPVFKLATVYSLLKAQYPTLECES